MAHLVDTSILARLANTADALHAMAAQAVLELHQRGEVLHVTAQNLIEFRNLATRPKSVNGLGQILCEGGGDMVSADTKAVIERAKRIYSEQLQAVLESQHRNRFVAIEPESGEYFLGDTFDEAVKSARAKHPSRLSHTIQIGHRAAFHMGGMRR